MTRGPALPAIAATVALALVLAGCAGEERGETTRVVERESPGPIVEPPSAGVPRVSPPSRPPDTLRASDVLDPGGELPDRVSPVTDRGWWPGRLGEADLLVLLEAYRTHYVREYYRRGAPRRDGIDPELAGRAKRRAARDRGYVADDPWRALVRSLTADQRIALQERIRALERDLVRRLHDS
ncbi:MAG: hypothetical protein R3199_05190 [Gemmatimonadota bacterium]|nr:hypothetical protein [Gemmatimonadota bacterium]